MGILTGFLNYRAGIEFNPKSSDDISEYVKKQGIGIFADNVSQRITKRILAAIDNVFGFPLPDFAFTKKQSEFWKECNHRWNIKVRVIY